MCHIDHKNSTYFVCNFTHTLVIPFTRISRSTTNNHLRMFTQGNFFHLIIIYASCFLIQIIFAWSIDDTRCIYSRTMRKMTTMCQVQSHELISRIQHCQKNSSICLCSRMRLYICPFSTKDLLQPVDCNLFTLIHNFATTIITLTRITFCILICKT